VDWLIHSSGAPKTVKQSQLRTFYPSTNEIREQFQAAMARYEDAVKTGDLPHVLRHSFGAPPLAGGRPVVPTTAAAPVPVPGEIATPQRYAALANLMTAADSVTADSLSTLTNDNMSCDPIA
jgi:hypothetical protein